MKFWVKAVVDDTIQEQLFVTATSTEELRLELESLLNIPIGFLSVHDFQSQVVDRLAEGEDIITVKAKQHRPSLSRKGSCADIMNTSRSSEGKLSSATSVPASASAGTCHQSGDKPSAGTHGANTSLGTVGPAASAGSASSKELTSSQLVRDSSGTHRRSTLWSPSLSLPMPSGGEHPRYAERGDSHDRMNSSLGSGQLFARGGGSAATSPAEADMLSMHSTSPSKAPQLMDFPPVAKLWLSREDVEVLLHRQFRGRYKSVLSGCFVRTRDRHGYNMFQIASVEHGPHGKLVLDTVYGSEAVGMDSISNAPPSSDEVRRWMKKVLNSTKPFPTHGFIEAKHGDVEAALGTARAILAGSPVAVSPPPAIKFRSNASRETEGNEDAEEDGEVDDLVDVQPAETTVASAPECPPSPVLSETEEAPTPATRVRRPTVLSQFVRTALASGKQSMKVNDVLSFTSVCFREAAEPPWGATSLVLYGTRHSNSKARKPRRGDFAGFEMVLQGASPSTSADADPRPPVPEAAPLPVESPSPTPTPSAPSSAPAAPVLRPHLLSPIEPPLVTGSTVASDRDVTEKGFAMFGAPVKWRGRYHVLGQRRPVRDVSSYSPYVQKHDKDDDSPGATLAHGEEEQTSDGALDARRVNKVVQDFILLAGDTPDCLQALPEPASLPVPPWALVDGREVVLLRPTLVEHLGNLHCLYLVRLDNTAAGEVRSPSSSMVKRRPSLTPSHPHRQSGSFPNTGTPSRTSSGRGNTMAPSPSMSVQAVEDQLIPATAAAPQSASGPANGGDTENATAGGLGSFASELSPFHHDTSSLHLATEQLQQTPPPPPPPPPTTTTTTAVAPPPYVYGLAHAVAVLPAHAAVSDTNVNANESASSAAPRQPTPRGSIAAAAAPRWRLLSTKGPLMEGTGEAEPLFAAVSSIPEDGAPMPSGTRVHSRAGSVVGAFRSAAASAELTPPEGSWAAAGAPENPQRRELNVLWHNPDEAALSSSTSAAAAAASHQDPSSVSPSRAGIAGSLFGSRASLRLSSLKTIGKEGGGVTGGSVVLTPAVSRRRSPAIASLQPEHSLGGRVEVPFQRIANAHEAVDAGAWVEDAYFAAVEVDPEKLKRRVESLSLFAADRHVFLTTVSSAGGRLVLWTVPVTGEP